MFLLLFQLIIDDNGVGDIYSSGPLSVGFFLIAGLVICTGAMNILILWMVLTE